MSLLQKSSHEKPSPERASRRRPAWRKVGSAWLALPALMLIWLFIYQRPQHVPLSRGQLAPAFALPDQEGRTHHLEDYRGRPVILLFFSELDEQARQSLRSLRGAMPIFDAAGIRVFALGRGGGEEPRRFHDSENLTFPLLTDRNGSVGKGYGLAAADDAAQRGAFIIGPRGTVLESITRLQPARLGEQLSTLAECCLSPSRQDLMTQVVGRTLSEVSLPRAADGKVEPVFGDDEHSATVLLFLSSRCPCSRGYAERVRDLAAEYGAQGVRVAAVFSSADERQGEITAHAKDEAFTFPVYWDSGNRFADACNAKVTPEAFLVDRKRVVRYHGRIDDSRVSEDVRRHDLRNALDALLAGHAPPQPEVRPFGCAISRVQTSLNSQEPGNTPL